MKYLESIEYTARTLPQTPALRTSAGDRMTYLELWLASEALASRIAGIAAPGQPVMVYGNKHPLMVACFLACMKAGCPYVPVDRFSVPPERVASIAAQIAGNAPLPVLASQPFPGVEGACAVELLDGDELFRIVSEGGFSDRSRWISGEDLAYILFTSGSTGAPKGVEVTADCFDNFCAWDLELSGGSPAVWLDQAPFSFDLSVFELAGALASGGTLFSLDHDSQQSASALLAALASSGIEVWVSTPSFASLCLANPEFGQGLIADLRLFIFCGETLPNATAARLLERFPSARVLNTYGPTESTVAVTSVEVTGEMAGASDPLPVGSARPGTRIRIVDASGAECAPGSLGEVVIEGDTVARGYYRRPDLTERSFGASELTEAPVRTYRTGDEGWLDGAGMLHYRGRLDLQVKLNGFRIELGDIEEHLRRLPEVAAAAVVPAVREGRVSHLVAHVVPAAPLSTTPFRAGLALKERLRGALPHYMIPKKVAFLDALPMTGNGKVDRRALAETAR